MTAAHEPLVTPLSLARLVAGPKTGPIEETETDASDADVVDDEDAVEMDEDEEDEADEEDVDDDDEALDEDEDTSEGEFPVEDR